MNVYAVPICRKIEFEVQHKLKLYCNCLKKAQPFPLLPDTGRIRPVHWMK